MYHLGHMTSWHMWPITTVRLCCTVMEIPSLKYFWVTTSNSWGHVTSSVTGSLDPLTPKTLPGSKQWVHWMAGCWDTAISNIPGSKVGRLSSVLYWLPQIIYCTDLHYAACRSTNVYGKPTLTEKLPVESKAAGSDGAVSSEDNE